MTAKIIEIRDAGTFIPVLAVQLGSGGAACCAGARGTSSRSMAAISPVRIARRPRDERELLLSQTCGACFDRMFAEEEEGDA